MPHSEASHPELCTVYHSNPAANQGHGVSQIRASNPGQLSQWFAVLTTKHPYEKVFILEFKDAVTPNVQHRLYFMIQTHLNLQDYCAKNIAL